MSDNFTFISNGVLSTYSYNNQGAFNPVANLVFTDSVSGNTVSINTTSISIANSTANINIVNPNTSQIASSNYWLNANGKWAQITSSVSTLDANNSNYLLGKTWNIPGQIGSSTPNTGNFTTVSSTTNTVTFGSSLYIVSNGNVGLGNSTPADKLSVQGSVSITGNTTITGNLIVTGTTVTVNTTTLDVKDLNITVAKGAATSSAANGAGLTVDGANALLYYNDSTTSWISNLNLKLINSNTFIGSHPSYSNSYSAFWREGNDYALLASDSNTFLNSPSGAIYFRKGNVNSGYFDGSQNFYAKNLYDIDNNNYYVDPASSSVVNNLTVSGTLSTTGGTTSCSTISSTTSVTAPIFYDYNNTGYYCDPASGSSLWQATSYAYFFGGVDGDSGQSNHSYAIYQGGGAWTHPYPDLRIAYHTGVQIGAQTGYGGIRFYSEESMTNEIMSVGKYDSHTRVINNFYAPIMYDYNDSGYYVDPASTSYINILGLGTTGYQGRFQVYNGGTVAASFIGGWSQYGKVIQLRTDGAGGQDGPMLWFLKQSAKNWGIGIRPYSGDNGFWISEDSSNAGWGSERFRMDPGGTSHFYVDLRSPIYYDENDTGYYCNPNGDSRLANIYNSYVRSYGDIRADGYVYAAGRLVAGEGQTSSWIEMRDTDEGTRYLHNNSGTIGFVGSHGSWRFRMADDGNVVMGTYQDWLSNQIRSNIYYDHSDTGYYCDPNGTSYLNQVRGNGLVIQVQTAVAGPARQTISSTSPVAVTGLSISFTPKYSTSKIVVMCSLNITKGHVMSFGLFKDGVATVSTSGQTNSNEPNMQVTIYEGADNDQLMQVPLYHYETAGSTAARTYAVYATAGWGGGGYTLYMNNRASNDMAAFSHMVIMEIAQ